MKIQYLITAIILFSIAGIMSGCSSKADNNATGNAATDISDSEKNIAIDKLEIYHFHGTHQCSSCIAVGQLAEETVNTYFADELKSGKIVFGHINGDLPENRLLVGAYGVTGSSLWIGTYTQDGKFSAEENVNVWYKINDKEGYMNYLKGIIEQKLAGN